MLSRGHFHCARAMPSSCHFVILCQGIESAPCGSRRREPSLGAPAVNYVGYKKERSRGKSLGVREAGLGWAAPEEPDLKPVSPPSGPGEGRGPQSCTWTMQGSAKSMWLLCLETSLSDNCGDSLALAHVENEGPLQGARCPLYLSLKILSCPLSSLENSGIYTQTFSSLSSSVCCISVIQCYSYDLVVSFRSLPITLLNTFLLKIAPLSL